MTYQDKMYAIFACILLLLIPATTFAHGEKKMEPLYDIKEAGSLVSQTFTAGGGLFGGYSNVSIFPVPFDNTVGSNDMGNAITLISFPKGKMDLERHFRNAKDITGSGKYLSTTAPNLIGFGQTRVFHLFDFQKKLHHEYDIEFPVTRYIEKIAIADSSRRRFIFEIESQKENPKNSFDVDYFLQLIDLSTYELLKIKEIKEEPGTVWTTTKDRVLLYRIFERQLYVLDMDMEPAHHPLENVFKQFKDQLNPFNDKIGFSRIEIHPYLPFAILYGGYRGSTFISWDKDRDNTPHLLIDYTALHTFSPDGKWVVFQKDYPEPYKTYIMAVSDKLPHYLGFPILISDKHFDSGYGAWTTKPTGYVGSYLDKIFRWDLENQDFPEKGKISFHDYIVQRDLERLTREKRQGLGK